MVGVLGGLVLAALPAQAAKRTPSAVTETTTQVETTSRIETRIDLEEPAKPRFLSLSVNTLPIGAGVALATPIVPIEAAINLGKGFSIGPTLTFSGTYKYQETDFSLSGYGAQAAYSFGSDALADGFYVQAFYTRYKVSAMRMVDMAGGMGMGGMGMNMMMPMEGSIPVSSYGAGVGYKWVWKSGFRLAASVRATHFASDSSNIELMGENANDSGLNDPTLRQFVDIPVIQDQAMWLPVPELALGWAF